MLISEGVNKYLIVNFWVIKEAGNSLEKKSQIFIHEKYFLVYIQLTIKIYFMIFDMLQFVDYLKICYTILT